MVRYLKRLYFEVNSVRYIMTLFWSILLMLMLTYVVSSMMGVAFNLTTALTLGIIATIAIFIFPAVLPEPTETDGAH